MSTTTELPTDYFDYADAIEDLYERFERARDWIGKNLNSRMLTAVYEYSLELAYLMIAFRELLHSQV